MSFIKFRCLATGANAFGDQAATAQAWHLANGDPLALVLPDDAGFEPVTLGLRPEHLILADKQQAQFCINLAHGILTPLEGEQEWVKGKPRLKTQRVTARLDGMVEIKEDETVYLTIDPANIHLFDAKSGI